MFAVHSRPSKATLRCSYHCYMLYAAVDFHQGALFYCIKTNSGDTSDKIKLNNTASSVGLMLTLDDKSYLNYLCVTWFYYVEKKQAQDGCKASLTWE